MIRIPWVSRERYNERAQEVTELKVEREKLIDRIAQLSGQPKIYGEVAAPPANEEMRPVKPMKPGKPTLEQLMKDAKNAAEECQRNGISIVQKIREGTSKVKVPNAS